MNSVAQSLYNDVNDWLTVGGDLDLARDISAADHTATIADLQQHGVTHVLDLRSEWQDSKIWRAAGAKYENIPIIDSHSYIPPESWFEAVEAFVSDFWLTSAEGDRLYVHCHMGVNRAPSAAMLALLTVDPEMHPFDAFLRIREARDIAGVIYAEAVGIRHLLNVEGIDDLTMDMELPESVVEFSKMMRTYWTPELRQRIGRGIAYYRSLEGGTIKVGGKRTVYCPSVEDHSISWNGGQPICMDCDTKPAVDLTR